MPTFDEKLQRYADLVVKIGLNLQSGQRLIIRQAPVDAAPLVRAITASAYKVGSPLVNVFWEDDDLTLARFEHAPRDSFAEFPAWETEALLQGVKRGDAMLSIHANNPDLLNGQNPKLVSTYIRTRQEHLLPVRNYTMRDAVNWLVIGVPIESWAAKIFPDAAKEEQIPKLWETIFSVCRLDQLDPIAAWRAHIQDLIIRSRYLNEKSYTALKYTGPGTDLTVGLPQGHIWKGAQSKSEKGITFVANLPTEEVFTMADKNRVDGVVSSTRPLNHQGMLIDGFQLTFAEGRVVKATAKQGESVLRDLIAADDGAGRLGEVALVPHSSPISQSGLLFYNTLFDENASSHLALGRAYRFNMQGGTVMTEEEFAAAGGNYSLFHVDFMVGSDKIDIDGVTANGQTEPVMRQGEWAFEV